MVGLFSSKRSSKPLSEPSWQRKYYSNSHTTGACDGDSSTTRTRVALTPFSPAVKFSSANELLLYEGSAEPFCIYLVTFVRLRA